MNKLFRNRQNSGITLIALVVTIVILLILAGVSINLVLGPNGLITKAQEAALKTEHAKSEEEAIMNNFESEILYNTPLKDDDLYIELKTFITEWEIPENFNFKLPLIDNDSYIYNFTVDWGDGSPIDLVTEANSSSATHVYSKADVYEIKINGICNGWKTSGIYLQRNMLIGIKQFGDVKVKELSLGYNENLTGTIPEPSKNSFRELEYITFRQCPKLKGGIPQNLFKGVTKVTDFSFLFERDEGLTGEIPVNLFRDCINATSFECAFDSCSGLTGNIPQNLFKYNYNANNFGAIFRNCCNLTGPIPEGLFKNTKTITYWAIFNGCTNLTGEIPKDFFEPINEDCVGYWDCFRDCKNITGIAPEIWNLVEDETKGTGCFTGCEKLSNWDMIPTSWK